MSASRSSSVSPAVATAGASSTVMVTGQISGLPFLIAARPPDTVTGTIGVWALIAITKPPFLNGSSSPVRLRVPSGKTTNELPSRRASAA